MNVFRVIFCSLIMVMMNVIIYSMELSPQRTMLKQRLEYESYIINDVTTFLESVNKSIFLSKKKSKEIEQVLGLPIKPEGIAIGNLNAICRSLMSYENFYDKEYKSAPALKKIKEGIDFYVLSLLDDTISNEQVISLFRLLEINLCDGVKRYLCHKDYNIKARLYLQLSSQELVDNTARLIAIDMVNKLYTDIQSVEGLIEEES